mmetsp:Transcript_13571/g.28768  ORF Transcript_13571/g.28768 Transcript_13571/m.28768 type:complete len:247 (-) Transcript_13571:318-1058(-)
MNKMDPVSPGPSSALYPPVPPPSSNMTDTTTLPPIQMNRSKGLEKLGVSEDDVKLAESILQHIPNSSDDPEKAERVLGYASSRLRRAKALRLLGASEEDLEIETAKVLGSLGVAGRRRSFAVLAEPTGSTVSSLSSSSSVGNDVRQFDVLVLFSRPKSFSLLAKIKRSNLHDLITKQRHTISSQTESEIEVLRNQVQTSSTEIESLKARIQELEAEVSGSKGRKRSKSDFPATSMLTADELRVSNL